MSSKIVLGVDDDNYVPCTKHNGAESAAFFTSDLSAEF